MKKEPPPKAAITVEQAAELEVATLKNIVEKIGAGGIPTARELDILKAATQPDKEEDSEPIRHVKSWDELAAALSVEKQTLYNFRKAHAAEIKRLSKPPTPNHIRLTMADNRHVVARWRALADGFGELNGRGDNNPEASIDERQLRLRERQFKVEQAEHKLAEQKRDVLPLIEYQEALRLLLSSFDTALKQIPGRSAARIAEASRQSMLALLKSEVTAKQFATLSALLTKPPLDPSAVITILDDEIETTRRVLAEADFFQT